RGSRHAASSRSQRRDVAMTGSDFIASLPAHAGPARERRIVEAVRAGAYAPVSWSPVSSTVGERSMVVYVSADALRSGSADDSVRVNVSAKSAQHIADLLGCILPTSRICDLVWAQATVRVPPCIG